MHLDHTPMPQQTPEESLPIADLPERTIGADDARAVRGGGIDATPTQLAAAAKQLDAATTSGGPTAGLNQKIQELTF